MPTYQYLCTECGDSLEVQQSFTEDALTVCPSCNGRLRKVFNAVGVVFKGSGFYATDSRTKKTSGATASTTESGSGESTTKTEPNPKSGSGSGSESKTATKSAPDSPSKSEPKKSSGAGSAA